MSQAIGPFCDLNQDVSSWNYTEGAAVALEMQEYEREREYIQYSIVHLDKIKISHFLQIYLLKLDLILISYS